METKPQKKTKIFISYKTGEKDGMTFTANRIKKELDAANYDVWMDVDAIQAGQNWNDQIYERIRTSDVLLLILGTTTINSDWVRREIDVAKGSGVTILPVLIRDDFDKQDTLDKFDIPRLQFVDMLVGDDKQFEKLITQLKNIQGQTLTRQKEWIDKRLQDEKGTPFEKTNQNCEYYKLQNPDKSDHPIYKDLVIHIATGDMIEMHDIDVLVNSENDYMQMARIFESKTVSALLRYYGSCIDKAGRLVEDTVQDELDCRIYADKELHKRPVGVSTVIVTNAGHPESSLITRNHARYIFHTAAVSVEDGQYGKYLRPVQSDSGLKRCVKNTLDKILEMNAARGNIWPEGTDERKQAQEGEKSYQPITSIVIPMFGSGHGGRETKEVIPAIVDGVHEFLIDRLEEKPNKLTLTDLYLCVYYQEDVEPMQQALSKNFQKIAESEYKALRPPKPAIQAETVSEDGVKKVIVGEQLEITLTETPPENGKPKSKEKKPNVSAN
jgi:O-acetyl-ADP-ribose deacetylase (regulator of RNase III)